MSLAIRVDGLMTRCAREIALFHERGRIQRSVFASSEAIFCVQDEPRPAACINDLLAMTKLASPNRLNNCASFFAKPL